MADKLPCVYMNFVPQTSGESLFKFVANELFSREEYYLVNKMEFLRLGGRASEFSKYFIGVKALNIVGRLIKKSIRTLEIEDSVAHQQEIVNYIQNHMELVSEGGDVLDKMARLSLDAAKNCNRPISNGSKKVVKGDAKEWPCYLCGKICFENSDIEDDLITYDHIWPSSFGGDSKPENLLPSCKVCNSKKGNMILWHTGAIFSFILKPEPSINEWTSIKKGEKIAKHMNSIFDYANNNFLTLKDSALHIGPANFLSMSPDNSEDAIDYFNFSFEGN